MIVVTAPTGQIGSQIVAHLLEGDEPVRVIARDPAKLDPTTRERVEVIEGSHSDPDTVTKAFDGADTVFWLVPPEPGRGRCHRLLRGLHPPGRRSDQRAGCAEGGGHLQPGPRLRQERGQPFGRLRDGRPDRGHGRGLPGPAHALLHGEPAHAGAGPQAGRARPAQQRRPPAATRRHRGHRGSGRLGTERCHVARPGQRPGAEPGRPDPAGDGAHPVRGAGYTHHLRADPPRGLQDHHAPVRDERQLGRGWST